MTDWPVHLYAILSQDDCIADAQGAMPKALMNEADWLYFQRELDSCALTVLGRQSHLSAPNNAKRRRVVMSRGVNGLEARDDAHWWNPEKVPLAEMLERLVAAGRQGWGARRAGGFRLFPAGEAGRVSPDAGA